MKIGWLPEVWGKMSLQIIEEFNNFKHGCRFKRYDFLLPIQSHTISHVSGMDTYFKE